MAMPAIRPAMPEDIPGLRNVARAAYAVYVPRIGREPAPMVADFTEVVSAGHVHLVAEGGEVLAFAIAWPRGDQWHLENVAVHPAAQGRGIGRALISHAEALARASGAQAVELYTNAAMVENQALYPGLGYAETDRRVEDGFKRIFYRKKLTAI